MARQDEYRLHAITLPTFRKIRKLDLNNFREEHKPGDRVKKRFSSRAQQTVRLEIKQQGDQVIAGNKYFDLKIIGKISGDSISFYALPSEITQAEITGEWQLTPDSDKVNGTWAIRNGNHPAKGDWNLRKVR